MEEVFPFAGLGLLHDFYTSVLDHVSRFPKLRHLPLARYTRFSRLADGASFSFWSHSPAVCSACRLGAFVSSKVPSRRLAVAYRWNIIHCATVTMLSWVSLSADSFARTASSEYAIVYSTCSFLTSELVDRLSVLDVPSSQRLQRSDVQM